MPYNIHGYYIEAIDEDDPGCAECGRDREHCCGNTYCDDCHPLDTDDDYEEEDDYEDGTLIHSYSYTPELHFRGGKAGEPGLPFYGMEIEITSSGRDKAQHAADRGGDLVYLKSDASVAGFEMVTHPMTYPWALENFPWDMLPELKSMGCTIRPNDNGIHVHVSRTGFDSDAHTLRWMRFFYNNQDDVVRIARRSPDHWGRFSAEHRRGQYAHLKAMKGQLDQINRRQRTEIRDLERKFNADRDVLDSTYRDVAHGDDYYMTGTRQVRYNEWRAAYRQLERDYSNAVSAVRRRMLEDTTRRDRYSAINTNNGPTFEVRSFASSLDPDTAKSALGLVSGSVEYTRHLTANQVIKAQGLEWPAFREWLTDQPLYGAVRLADEKCRKPVRARATI